MQTSVHQMPAHAHFSGHLSSNSKSRSERINFKMGLVMRVILIAASGISANLMVLHSSTRSFYLDVETAIVSHEVTMIKFVLK